MACLTLFETIHGECFDKKKKKEREKKEEREGERKKTMKMELRALFRR